mgnify:CR=1 FL=1
MIELVHKENNRLAQLLGVTKMVLSTYFGTILSVQQQNGRISTLSAVIAAPTKSSLPGQSIMFSFLPFHST